MIFIYSAGARIAQNRFVHSEKCSEDKVSLKNMSRSFRNRRLRQKQTDVCIKAQFVVPNLLFKNNQTFLEPISKPIERPRLSITKM
ncbi:hypothetical protein [Leptospira interrogans]|uniref:hypothetical protein n=1 Tax=Leptospira interrogans TaxID=173 RepID=UPI0002B8C1D6|nr:hypothetical protein [Leptospira interrogans]EMF73449.1 hypothetical protein LEP1GSC148_1471 [Leptospira interrogans serovar Canicola str. LT1962]EMM91994.1 hypothetical protein LEP1GSC145_0603 [Leptospira interrogans serovar Djasiman str. LT1649]